MSSEQNSCSICGKDFAEFSKLADHIRAKHAGDGVVEIPYEDKIFEVCLGIGMIAGFYFQFAGTIGTYIPRLQFMGKFFLALISGAIVGGVAAFLIVTVLKQIRKVTAR